MFQSRASTLPLDTPIRNEMEQLKPNQSVPEHLGIDRPRESFIRTQMRPKITEMFQNDHQHQMKDEKNFEKKKI